MIPTSGQQMLELAEVTLSPGHSGGSDSDHGSVDGGSGAAGKSGQLADLDDP